MKLINLDLIRILYHDAKFNKSAAVKQSLGTLEIADFENKPPKMSDGLYVHLIKTHVQAKVIYRNLKRLHRVCTDFAVGNFQPYIDKHNKYEEIHVIPEYHGEYYPYGELDMPFNMVFNFPLPRRIEQFPELYDLCRDFSKVSTLKREGLNPFFGNEPMWYEYTDENGETDILPPSELPEDFVYSQVVTDELRSVEVEYCLDGYNEFYFLAKDYITTHGDNEVSECASKILALYK